MRCDDNATEYNVECAYSLNKFNIINDNNGNIRYLRFVHSSFHSSRSLHLSTSMQNNNEKPNGTTPLENTICFAYSLITQPDTIPSEVLCSRPIRE